MNAHKQKKSRYRALIISIGLSVLFLFIGILFVEGLTPDVLYRGLMKPVARLMGLVFIGLLAGQIIEFMGWTRYLSRLAGPLFKFSGLGSRCSAAFTAAFFSGVSANAMLMGFYKDGRITREQMFLSNFVNQFPAYVLHLPTTFFIVIPLTGKAGLLYFGVTFSALLLRTALFLIYGNIRVRVYRDAFTADPDGSAEKTQGKTSLTDKLKAKIPARFTTILIYVLPIYIGVFLLHRAGLFDFIQTAMRRHVTTSYIPVESISVVILGFTSEFTAGFAAAGALRDAGVLTLPQTVVALVIGNVLAFPVRALRHQLPRYVGIFSPSTGTLMLLMGQGFRVVSVLVVCYFFYRITS
ncbi:MAG: nucleoside recognition protein [Deltaproteobacteria bacterium]|nr:MAG: nucleoside recognition protein [Deltaproteobacteria bacterium]